MTASLQNLERLPEMVRMDLPDSLRQKWEMEIGFTTGPGHGSSYLGRNHPLVTALSQYLFEEALANGADALHPVAV